MPGRDDFGKIQSKLLSDERAHRAAAAYHAQFGIPEDLAFAAVVGHVAMLAVYVARQTDDGVLEGSGHSAFRAAAMAPASIARVAVEILREVGLLRTVESGTYVCGFAECYGKLVKKRAEAKARMFAARSANVPRTCAERAQNVPSTLSERAPPEERRGEREENPSPTPSGDRRNEEPQNRTLITGRERWFGERKYGATHPTISSAIAELNARKPKLTREDFVALASGSVPNTTEPTRVAAAKIVFSRDDCNGW